MSSKIQPYSEQVSLRKKLKFDLEQLVLGAFIASFHSAKRLIHKLNPEHFSSEVNKKIAAIIVKMFSEGKSVDLVTVSVADKSIYPTDIMDCLNRVAGDGHLESHLALLKSYYILESLIVINDEIRESCEQNNEPVNIIATTQAKFAKLLQDNSGEIVSTESAVREIAIMSSDIGEAPKGAVPFFLRSLDDIVYYAMPGDLHIIAGRPGMGKTALALTCATNQARKGYRPVVFSLEMNKQQVAARQLAFESNCPVDLILKNKLNSQGRYAVQKASETVPHFLIDDSSGLTDLSFRSHVLRLKSQGLCDIVYVDYLQLMKSAEFTRGMSRENEISAISRSLKITAKEADIPVIALSQLSRAVESRGGDKRPQLSDLRESGSIEQDASLVMFTFRPEYYGMMLDSDNNSLKGIGIVIIAKNRNGALDDAIMHFRNHTTMWYCKEDQNQTTNTSDEF